jgi:hypothetical protein
MLLILDAVMVAMTAITIAGAGPIHRWIIQNVPNSKVLQKLLTLIVALCILVPFASVLLSQIQQHTSGLSAETAFHLATGIGIFWAALTLIVPAAILGVLPWDLKAKDWFRFCVGFFLFGNIILLGWSLINEVLTRMETSSAIAMPGPLRWGFPVGLFILVFFDYFILKLGKRIYEATPGNGGPVPGQPILNPTPEPAPKKSRGRKTRAGNE